MGLASSGTFWEIAVSGALTNVGYGAIGGKGARTTRFSRAPATIDSKDHGSAGKAAQFAAAQVKLMEKKGYAEVAGGVARRVLARKAALKSKAAPKRKAEGQGEAPKGAAPKKAKKASQPTGKLNTNTGSPPGTLTLEALAAHNEQLPTSTQTTPTVAARKTLQSTGSRLDPAVSSMNRAVGEHGVLVGDYHSYCTLIDPGNNARKEYRLQLVQAQGCFYVFKRWGRIGSAGQCSLTPEGGNADKASAAKEFKRVFKSKTGVAWAQRGTHSTTGKYQHGADDVLAAATGGGTAGGSTAQSELERIRQAGASDPTNTAHQLALRGLFDEGIGFARTAVDRFPDNGVCLSNLGYFCLARRAFAEAEVMLKKAVSLGTGHGEVNLGLCLALRTKQSKAPTKKSKASPRAGAGAGAGGTTGKVKFSKAVAAIIAKTKGSHSGYHGEVWQYRNNLAKVWGEDAADDETGELANDVMVVRAFATALE